MCIVVFGFQLGWGLTGCASIDPELVRSLAAGKRVVVVDAVPDEVPLSWMDTTVFKNEFSTMTSEKWPVRDGLNSVWLPSCRVRRRDWASKLASANNDMVLNIFSVSGPDPIFQLPPFIRGVGVRQRHVRRASTLAL